MGPRRAARKYSALRGGRACHSDGRSGGSIVSVTGSNVLAHALGGSLDLRALPKTESDEPKKADYDQYPDQSFKRHQSSPALRTALKS